MTAHTLTTGDTPMHTDTPPAAPAPLTLTAALDAYARAVADRVWTENHGTYGDGRPEAARRREAAARRAILTAKATQ